MHPRARYDSPCTTVTASIGVSTYPGGASRRVRRMSCVLSAGRTASAFPWSGFGKSEPSMSRTSKRRNDTTKRLPRAKISVGNHGIRHRIQRAQLMLRGWAAKAKSARTIYKAQRERSESVVAIYLRFSSRLRGTPPRAMLATWRVPLNLYFSRLPRRRSSRLCIVASGPPSSSPPASLAR